MSPDPTREPTPSLDQRTAALVVGGLAALVIARAALVALPGTWLWSLQTLRFTPPLPGWALLGLAAVALFPAVARAQHPFIERLETWCEKSPRLSTLVGALSAMMVVAAFPDRTSFLGDFLLRAGVLQSGRDIGVISPQSLPLDRLIHIELPRLLVNWGWAALPEQASRIVDALEAGMFAGVALALGRELSAGRGVALRFAITLLGGSALALFTGYPKSACDLCVLTTLFVLGAVRQSRSGRGAAIGSVALALALAAHRSALLLVPAWFLVWAVAWRARRIAWRDPRNAIALAGPVALLVVWGPRFLRILFAFDVSHHLGGPQVAGAGGPVAAALAPLHLLDVANLVMAYAPLAPLALILTSRRFGREGGREPSALALGVLALSALAMALLVHPQQGVFRDWDVFAVSGSVFAVLTAWALAAALGEPATSRRASAAVIWSAVLSAGLWLGQAADTDRGLARAIAFVHEPPKRSGYERGKTWEFLGDRFASLGRWEEAAVALDQAVVDQPSPRLFRMLGVAEAQRGRWEASEAAIFEAARRDPSDSTTWAVLVSTALTRGDSAVARAAAIELRKLSPHHPLVQRALGTP